MFCCGHSPKHWTNISDPNEHIDLTLSNKHLNLKTSVSLPPGNSAPSVHSAYLSRLTKPASVQVDGDKNGGNSEEVDHRVDLQPEPQLIIGCYELWEIKRRKKSLFYYFTNKQNK